MVNFEKRILAAARTLMIFAFLCSAAFAQTSATTAAIKGGVVDAAGAGVAGVSIVLRDTATNQTRAATSSADGTFQIPNLTVSIYEIRATANGFAPYVNSQLALALGQTATLDIVLQAGSVSESVIVTDKPPAIDATQTASTTSIDPERIEELPVSSRNYLQFTLLAPNVAPSNSQTANGGGGNISNSPLADSGFTFGGLRPRSNSISIDGLENTDETTGAALVALSPEIVREFQIVNNGASAEFGGAAGGAINVITKTGANDFHGTLFNFFQNESLNARNPLGDSKNRLRFRRFQPGASLGGAIIKNKLFFYAAAEQENLTSDEESEINRIVRTRINHALAAGFAPRLAVRFLDDKPFRTGADETEAAGKLTYLAGSRTSLNFRFAFTNNRQRGEAFNADALADRSARGSTYAKDYQFTASAVSVLTAKIINDFRLQFSTRRFVSNAGDKSGTDIEIVGAARFGRPFDADGTRRERRWQFVDNISFARGANEEWKTGVNINRVSLDADLRAGFGGEYVFRSIEDFLAARPAIFRQAFGDSRTKFDVTNFGAFVQNRRQFLRNLTLNLGLRYDAEKLPAPFRTDKNNFSPRVGVAFSPSKKLVFRAGFGLFYDRLPLAFLNPAIQKNGARAFEQIAYDARAAQTFAGNGGGQSLAPVSNIAPSIYRADREFKTPYSIQTFAGVERLLDADTTVRAEFLLTRGVHLPRTRNINLLPPTILTTANAASLGVQNPTAQQIGRLVFGAGRIDSRYDAVYQSEDSASSTYRGLSISLNKRLSNEFEFLATYTLSKIVDDASDFDEQPANPFDLRAERAASLLDIRHRFVLSGVFELPFGDEEETGANKKESLIEEIFKNIEIAPIVTLSSGRPFDALTGTDEERGGAFPFSSRPLGFARNALRTPKFFNTDLRVVKYVPLNEKSKIDFAFEFFNLFNRPNVAAVNRFYGSNADALSTFKTPTLYNAPRQFRFSIDLEF